MTKVLQEVKKFNMENEDFTGQVVWWCDKRGIGILHACAENFEVYFDLSVCTEKSYKRGQLVDFNFNFKVTDCTCAKNVKLIK